MSKPEIVIVLTEEPAPERQIPPAAPAPEAKALPRAEPQKPERVVPQPPVPATPNALPSAHPPGPVKPRPAPPRAAAPASPVALPQPTARQMGQVAPPPPAAGARGKPPTPPVAATPPRPSRPVPPVGVPMPQPVPPVPNVVVVVQPTTRAAATLPTVTPTPPPPPPQRLTPQPPQDAQGNARPRTQPPRFDAHRAARQQIEAERRAQRRREAIEEARAEIETPGGRGARQTAKKVEQFQQAFNALGMMRSSQAAAKTGELMGAVGTRGAAAGAGAVGVAGAAVAVADLAAKRVAEMFDRVGNTARNAAEAMGRLARNENSEAFAGAADRAAEALGKIPIAGQVMESAIKSMTTVFRSARDTIEAFVNRGKELAKYSPHLAASNARTSIKEMMADMQEAQALGPALAKLNDSYTDLKMMLREILLPIKKAIVETLVKLLEKIMVSIKYVADTVAIGIATVQGIYDIVISLLKFDVTGAANAMNDTLKKIEEILTEKLNQKEDKPDWMQLIEQVRAAAFANPAVQWVPNGVDPVMAGQAAAAPVIPPGLVR